MTRYEYARVHIVDIPEEVIKDYKRKKVDKNGYVYIEIRKGMSGLPQAGILVQELLEKRLAEFGYTPVHTEQNHTWTLDTLNSQDHFHIGSG